MLNQDSALTAKQQQRRAHNIPIEEVYTEHDINRNSEYNKLQGYNFQYNNRWLNAFSNRKMIGVRRLELNPNAYMFDLQFRVTAAEQDFTFTKGIWCDHGEMKFNGKLLPFEQGEYEFGPILTEEFNSTDGNSFQYNTKTDYEYCEVNSYAYRVRYEYKVHDGKDTNSMRCI